MICLCPGRCYCILGSAALQTACLYGLLSHIGQDMMYCVCSSLLKLNCAPLCLSVCVVSISSQQQFDMLMLAMSSPPKALLP